MKTNIFSKIANLFSNSNSNSNSDTATQQHSENFAKVFNFDKIGTIAQYELCKQVITSFKTNSNSNPAKRENLYNTFDYNTARTLLSELRKENKMLSDHFLTIQHEVNAHSDTATAICKTATAHTDNTQKNVRAMGLGALNYAIKKYNSNNIVTISEIKEAYNQLTENDIYKYYAVSTMCFNARALLAKCVNNAMQNKIKSEKATAKENKNK